MFFSDFYFFMLYLCFYVIFFMLIICCHIIVIFVLLKKNIDKKYTILSILNFYFFSILYQKLKMFCQYFIFN